MDNFIRIKNTDTLILRKNGLLRDEDIDNRIERFNKQGANVIIIDPAFELFGVIEKNAAFSTHEEETAKLENEMQNQMAESVAYDEGYKQGAADMFKKIDGLISIMEKSAEGQMMLEHSESCAQIRYNMRNLKG